MGLTAIEFTHTVTLAGSGFGFLLVVGVFGFLYFKNGRRFKALKKKKYLLPFGIGVVVMVLASSCAGGLLGRISGFTTGAGNQGGALVSRGMVGGNGAVDVAQHARLTYSGSWIALAIVLLASFFLWFAKNWGERLLLASGAVVGSTWGLTISLGGIATFSGIPLANWLGSLLIG
ncbi:hypothetical protein BX265_8369 [Streptomyces sp. TLI_235]|nr:hypothetical protein [Streptomyces sp. TLI_235]PBC66304.1 hypothetical protein BX265_8369 [Streptomyces sp. TLI_235]